MAGELLLLLLLLMLLLLGHWLIDCLRLMLLSISQSSVTLLYFLCFAFVYIFQNGFDIISGSDRIDAVGCVLSLTPGSSPTSLMLSPPWRCPPFHKDLFTPGTERDGIGQIW
jgi:hypothetical protein